MSYQQPPGDPYESVGSEDPPTSRSCTACGAPDLEPGFVQDMGQGSMGAAKWVRGALERGLFGGAMRMGRDKIDVEAWRCPACGHLELFVP